MAAPAQPVHLTTEALAERLHKTPNAIRIMRSRGHLPRGFRCGNDCLTPVELVEAWEREQLARSA